MKIIIITVLVITAIGCKRYNLQSVRVDTLRITDPSTNDFYFKGEKDTVYIRNNTIIHTQDSGCKSTLKIVTNSTKEYLPSRETNSIIESPFFSKSIKRIIYISLVVFGFGTVLVFALLLMLIIKK
jgi:hypothetical protein